jgi:hypothetical protein
MLMMVPLLCLVFPSIDVLHPGGLEGLMIDQYHRAVLWGEQVAHPV